MPFQKNENEHVPQDLGMDDARHILKNKKIHFHITPKPITGQFFTRISFSLWYKCLEGKSLNKTF